MKFQIQDTSHRENSASQNRFQPTQNRNNQNISTQNNENQIGNIQLIQDNQFQQSANLVEKCQQTPFKRCLICGAIFATILIIALVLILKFVVFKDPVNLQSHIQNQNQGQVFDLITLKSSSAVCLDGSPGTYYLSRTGNPQKVFIFFQGGGWCGKQTYQTTIQSCYKRTKTDHGTSKQNKPVIRMRRGILSPLEENYFKDWKRVYFSYCDGSGHQGTRKDPIQYKNTSLYFRGHNLTTQRFQDLEKRIGLYSKAKQIVIGGQSAGGLASFYWSGYVAQKTKNAVVKGFGSSGVFLDRKNNQRDRFTFRQGFIGILNITNNEIDHPMTQCVKQFPNQKYKCMFVEYMYQHITVPTFFVQSLYDTVSIVANLRIKCNQQGDDLQIQQCSPEQKKIVRQYRQDTRNVLKLIGQNKQNGIWAIDCIGHIYLSVKSLNPDFEVPQKSGNTIVKAFRNWIQNQTNEHVLIDNVQWPNNKPCSYDRW